MNLKVNDKIFVLNNDSGAVIKEVLYSEHAGGHVYVVEFEDGTTGNFFAGDLKKVDDVHFEIEVEQAGNVMLARLIRIDPDGKRTAINYAHGHIMHDGARGIVQAASWALKTLYNKMMGGSF